jgi:hypothetical protein
MACILSRHVMKNLQSVMGILFLFFKVKNVLHDDVACQSTLYYFGTS